MFSCNYISGNQIATICAHTGQHDCRNMCESLYKSLYNKWAERWKRNSHQIWITMEKSSNIQMVSLLEAFADGDGQYGNIL